MQLEETQSSDMKLEDLLQNSIENYFKSDEFKKMLQDKIEKAVSDVIADVFSYRSDLKAKLRNKIEELMTPSIERLDFTKYEIKLQSVLESILEKSLLDSNQKLLTNFRDVMMDPEKKSYNLDELFSKYLDCCDTDIDIDYLEVDTDDEPTYIGGYAHMEVGDKPFGRLGSVAIKFYADEDEDLSYLLRLYKDDKHENMYDIAYSVMENVNLMDLTHINSFNLFIMNLKNHRCQIEIHPEDFRKTFEDIIDCVEKPEPSWN